MAEGRPNGRGVGEEGDDLHLTPAGRAQEREHLVDAGEQSGPSSPSGPPGFIVSADRCQDQGAGPEASRRPVAATVSSMTRTPGHAVIRLRVVAGPDDSS